jgi:hypothetical protein
MKLTTWNIEHFGKLLVNQGQTNAQERLRLISREIRQIDPDILCIIEAPGDPILIDSWIQTPAENGGLDGKYRIAMIEGTETAISNSPFNARKSLQNLYGMMGTDLTGSQWIWFILKTKVYNECFVEVQKPAVWQGLTGLKTWSVNYWGSYTGTRLQHWRHPQTLILNIEGYVVEVIGVHLKSKINRKKAFSSDNVLSNEYIDEALKARVKLATEAFDIRMYIEQRFQQEGNPFIIVLGDLNDGPGREYFEKQYMYFDLVSNIQGDIFFSSRFLNHALFDYEEHLRWSTEFNDSIEKWALENVQNYNQVSRAIDVTRQQLIDHILFTQAFVNKENATGTKNQKEIRACRAYHSYKNKCRQTQIPENQ